MNEKFKKVENVIKCQIKYTNVEAENLSENLHEIEN